MQLQIESGLYERQAESPKIENFAARLPAPQSDLARQMLKDPYMLDFLDLGEEAHERAIEKALIKHLATFMLELGKNTDETGESEPRTRDLKKKKDRKGQ